ncbi:MAG: polysialyltransferase family glycosyltransferase, partial [Cyclobacteriaceae bacterium]|nr:polysialyltransferase family glycosyltransferase [Cyclobacteriaceae bacterium]
KKDSLPKNIKAFDFFFDEEHNVQHRVQQEIISEGIDNLFVVNAYRPLETYVLSLMNPRRTQRHLIQDGALFYNKIEKSVFLNHTKNVFHVYKGLWKKKIWFTDLLYYGRYMEHSGYIDQVWMTNPEQYVGPALKKKVNVLTLFPNPDSIPTYSTYFGLSDEILEGLQDCLLYLPVFVKTEDKVQDEINCIKRIVKKLGKQKVFIKLHPNAFDYQLKAMKEAFGSLVFKNNVAAEIYIANARNSHIVACASTSLFFYNPSCKYFALKRFYQDLGIYSSWYNIHLPPHVNVVDSDQEIF